MIELTVVILIIAILAALILPAAMSARASARKAAIRGEMTQFGAAIAQFRNLYGSEPPSSVGLYTTPAGWNSDPASMAKIRRLWPNFNFQQQNGIDGNGNANPAAIWYPTGWPAANTLTGAECLLFFLGGIMDRGAPQGFSKNPAAPFTPPGSDERDGPFFTFVNSRFTDVDNDGFGEYKDSWPTQTAPMIYASSYDGQGYNSFDLMVYSNSTPTAADMSLPYQTYTSAANPVAGRRAINPKSFQIISPGPDGLYGAGGVWAESPDFTTIIQSDVTASGGQYANAQAAMAARVNEMDNITNFIQNGSLGGR